MLLRLGAILLLAAALVAGESITVTFTPSDAGGEYGPLYVQAAWIETQAGDFVKSIGQWRNDRWARLYRWALVAGATSKTFDQDGLMGATINGYATPAALKATWNMAYKSGASAPDGSYVVWLETVNADMPRPIYASTSHAGTHIFTFTVPKDGIPRTTPQAVVDASGGYSGVSWTYTGRAPTIAAAGQPAAQSVVAGSTATFAVTAGGGTLAYQWKLNGTAIPGATAATYTTPATVLADSGGIYTCMVGNGDGGVTSGGTTTSNGATLTVTAATAAPSITTAPAATTVGEGQPASFTVVAGGTAPLSYQWQRNGVDIPGATAAGYTLAAATRAGDDGAVFRCVVSGTGAPATSAGATLTVNRTAVAILGQTIARAVDLGSTTSTTFNVVATGTAPLAYQWKKGGVDIAGATAASYTKSGLVLADNGSSYTCAVTGIDAAGNPSTVTTAAIPLTAGIAPSITTQPTSKTVAAGGTATVSIATSGTVGGYVWYRNGIPVAFTASYTIPATDTQVSCNGDTYYCIAQNPFGEVQSSTITLTVTGSVPAGTAPTITRQPAAATSEGVGWQSTFFVIANGSAPLSYQWRKNGVAIAGATASAYTTPAALASDANNANYSCVVSNASGSATSANAALRLQNQAIYATQPISPQSKLAGQTATFSIAVNGTANLLYKWFKNGVQIGGATATSYTTPALTAADDGARYYCIAYNSDPLKTNANYADSYSQEAVVSVLAITGQPQAQTVTAGQTATFSVTATGAGLSYQWRKGGVNIAGATAASYTTPATTLADNGAVFSCVVTCSAGSVTSNGATLTVNSSVVAPSITGQPSPLTRSDGQSASFSVTATGTAPLTYQWYRGGVAIGGATAATYSIAAVTLADDGASFTCTVTNSAGSATSSAAVLTVNPAAPAITSQPTSQTVNVGQTATFAVAAGGSAPLTYQWKRNGSSIAGANAANYTTPAATLADDGDSYVCVVTNAAGSATSAAATLTVQAPPTVTADPISQTVAAGATATFTVTAAGSPTLTYQWYRNGVAIGGATAASYTTPATTAADDGKIYTCGVNNAYGSATSAGATLTVQAPPAITTQPGATTVTAPATATFAVAASGSAPLTYQWRKGGVNIAGATAASYTTPATAFADDGSVYSCVVSNAFGSATSAGATLTVHAAPSITAQPSPQTAASGATATFTVVASGTAPLAYQWRKNGVNIGGATAASYTTPVLAFADDGAVFSCVVSNAYGSATSAGATLTVQAPPTITAQPVAQTVAAGATATFAVTATGSPTLTYQWRKNGVNIGGATAASYTTPATTFADDGAAFTCVVGNAFGNATSTGATLTVQAAPSITTPPSSQAVNGGQTATFGVVAAGSPTMAYQWRRNGTNIGGATAASYTTPATTLADDGAVFTCRVSNPYGNVVSAGATLTVQVPPAITSQPSPQSVTIGATATFTVAATGSPTLAYQWSRNGVAIGGATAATYTTSATTLADDGAQYACTVSNSYGSAASAAATLSVTAAIVAPAITGQPAAQAVLEGQAATFTVVATGSAPLTYQWSRDGTPIGGATAASYITPATILADDGGTYTCVVGNGAGTATSAGAVLSVAPAPPAITAQPVDQTVAAGATATFAVTASGSATLAYQWRRNGGAIAGATAASYTTQATTFGDDGAVFTCVVTNAAGSIASGGATLTVHAAPLIVTAPADQTVGAGTGATFTVVAAGSAPLSYQWNRNGTPIGGANAASYTTPPAAIGEDGDQFTCTVANPYGSATSAAATLTVTAAPVITIDPSDQTVVVGVTATFAVAASGSGLSYQWTRGGTPIAGATAATYTTPATAAGDDGAQFACVVSNAYGSATSLAATLRVTVPPSVTVPPADQSVLVGQSATFTVVAAGSAPLSYQWNRDGVPIPSAISAGYTTPATALADDGAVFTCTVTNPYGSVVSAGALLTVQIPVGGKAYVSFTPSSAGGPYAPSHVLAAWVESGSGAFVRTIGDWSGLRRPSLTLWQSRSGPGDNDAIMGATRNLLTPVTNVVWDLTAASDGLPVADGTYRLWLELVDTDTPAVGTRSISGAHRTSVAFTISGAAVVPVGPLFQDGFSNLTITPGPVVGPKPVITDTAGGLGGCGGGAVYGLILPLFALFRGRGVRRLRWRG